MQKKSPVNNDIYDQLGDRWYTADDDPVALLRAESKLRNPWVVEELRKEFGEKKLKILDIGCGAGFLSNYLAAIPEYEVMGVDLSEESLRVAKAHDSSGKATYALGNGTALFHSDESQDVVCAMDFLEHVDDPAKAISEMGRVLKSGGLFFFHTFNRNWISNFVAIRLVEWFVPNTPKDMHVHHLFITPEELDQYCKKANLEIVEMKGVSPRLFSWSVLKGAFIQKVPKDFSFRFTSSLRVGFSGFARKRR